MQAASVISGVGITALRGLEDVLGLRSGESILIFGAGGGVGHLAAQLANHKGARVLAVASGEDGVKILKNLGIKQVVDGRKGTEELLYSMKQFAPEGFDSALLTAGVDDDSRICKLIRKGGHIAYPYGIAQVPNVLKDVKLTGYYGEPEPSIIQRLNNYIELGALKVHIDNIFSLVDIMKAHEALSQHYVGKLCLKIS